MARAKLTAAWDQTSLLAAIAVNAAGSGSGTPAQATDYHPFRDTEVIEHDITVLKKLLE